MKRMEARTRVLAVSALCLTVAYLVNACSDSASVPSPLNPSTSVGTSASDPVVALGDSTEVQTASAQNHDGGWPGPPAEALAACEDKAVDNSCSFTGLRGNNVEGTCRSRPDSDRVVCFPNDRPNRPNRRNGDGPPPELLAACDTLSENDECTAEAPFGTFTGTCSFGRNGENLLCRPEDRPRRR